MIEPQLVDVPTQFPMMCSCGNQKGPMVDTFRDRHGVREYVCGNCASAYAKLFRKQFGAPAEAAQTIARLEREIEGALEQLKAEREDSELKDQAIDGLKAERDKLSGRVDQLEERIATVAGELVA